MKIKFLPLLTALFAGISLFTSCLDDDETVVEYGAETSIQGFSLGTLHIDRMGVDRNGEDSAYVDSIDCSKYPFTINQATRVIENKDSLPMGIHLDKVLVNIIADTEIIAYKNLKNGEDTIWSRKDSIDFTTERQFRVYTYDYRKGSPYTIKVNRHKQDPDSIMWKDFDDLKFAEKLTRQKAIFAEGKLFVFGRTAANKPVYYYSTVADGKLNGWSSGDFSAYPEAADVETYSAMLWKNEIYLKTTSGLVYKVSVADPAQVSKSAKEKITHLILANGERMYVGQNSTSDETEYGYWENNTFVADPVAENIPEDQAISSAVEPVEYNESLSRMIALTYNNGGTAADSTALVYYRLSNTEKWIKFEPHTTNYCPNLKDIVMLRYDKRLFAFGGMSKGAKEQIKPFASFYCSEDYGRTWQKPSEKVFFPEKYSQKYLSQGEGEGLFSAAVDEDNYLWIIWKDGSVSRGRINHLGFLPKWN